MFWNLTAYFRGEKITGLVFPTLENFQNCFDHV